MSSERTDPGDPATRPGSRREPAVLPGTGPAETESDPRHSALRLTDPKAMRALAHPVRMALLEIIGATPTLTATQASEMLGESPANCAFHLRTLAKYGYIKEAGGGRGRERPWTIAHRSITVSGRDQEPQARLAAQALSQVWHERLLDRIRRTFARNAWPPGWEHAPQSSSSVLYLTAGETEQVAAALLEVLEPYMDRRFDPSLRPAGALPVEFALFGFPRDDLTAVPPASAEEDQTGE